MKKLLLALQFIQVLFSVGALAFSNFPKHFSLNKPINRKLFLPPMNSHNAAHDAIMLLHGEELHADSTLTWTVLLVGGYYVYYKIFQFLAKW